jgi:CubicO group peptidase (beta-lactamase class C family)
MRRSAKAMNPINERQIEIGSESTLVLEAGWRHIGELDVDLIESPERTLRVWLSCGTGQDDDAAAIRDAWERVRPSFSLQPSRITQPPNRRGWERWCNVAYDIPPSEEWTAWANLRAFRGRCYIALIEGPRHVMGRREAQLISLLQSWQPAGFARNNLVRAGRMFSVADFDSFVKAAMTRLQIPGVSLAVLDRGDVVFSQTYGAKSLAGGEPIDRDTCFLIGSITKPLTTLMMAQLVDRRIVDWDQPIADRLPGFALGDPDLTARLTFRLSVSASTGMPRRDTEMLFRGHQLSADGFLHTMRSMISTTGLGETFQYSNPMVAAGGYAAARAYCPQGTLNAAYAKAMAELVFRPLRMTASSIAGTDPMPPNRAMPHDRDRDCNMVPVSPDFAGAVHCNSPAGAAWSTAEDLARYVRLELANGIAEDGARIVAETPLLERRAPGVRIDRHTRYGLGLMVEDRRGMQVIGHGGSIRGFVSDLLFVPNEGSGLIVLTNSACGHEFIRVVRAKLFEMLFGDDAEAERTMDHFATQRVEQAARFRVKVAVGVPDTSWLAEWCGRYRNADLGSLEVRRRDNRYFAASESWTLEVGVCAQSDGGRTIIVVEPPFIGLQWTPRKVGKKRALVLNDSQETYEFLAD